MCDRNNRHVDPVFQGILNAFAPLATGASEIFARSGKPLPLPGETPLDHAKRLSNALHPCPAPKQIEKLAKDIEAADDLPERMGKAIRAFNETDFQKRQKLAQWEADIERCDQRDYEREQAERFDTGNEL